MKERTARRLRNAFVTFCSLTGLALGLGLSWLVAVPWHYFGATLVDVKTVIGVWVMPALILTYLMAQISMMIAPDLFKIDRK